jgi:Fic family protein
MSIRKKSLFSPNFTITPAIAGGLMRIEAVKQSIPMLPITPRVLANLRETARLFSTHYSTMIEGNRLTQEQVEKVLSENSTFQGVSATRTRSKNIMQLSTKWSAQRSAAAQSKKQLYNGSMRSS